MAEPTDYAPTRLVLIRHARRLRPTPARLGDGHELGLSDDGREEAERLRSRLARTRELGTDPVLLASGARCAVETAASIAPAIGAAPSSDCAFCEPHVGEAAGTPVDEWSAGAARERLARWSPYAPKSPGGESIRVAIERASRALVEVVIANPGRTVVVVTHPIPLRASLWAFLGLPFHGLSSEAEFSYTGITEWLASGWVPGTGQMRARLVRHNDAAHLSA